MEFRCPECGKRLRVPDEVRNPLVRCRSCGATFRPALQTDRSQDEAGRLPESPEREESRDETSTRTPAAPRRSAATGGLGIAGFILLLLLAKAPRLVKQFFNDQPRPAPAPVRLEQEELRAIEKMLDEARGEPEQAKQRATDGARKEREDQEPDENGSPAGRTLNELPEVKTIRDQ